MKYIREHSKIRLFWLLLSFHFINGSIDPADFILNGSSIEDISINEIETIVEFIAEEVLEIDDCFPEQNEPYEDGNPIKEIKNFTLFYPILSNSGASHFYSDLLSNRIFFDKYLHPQFSPAILSPPPKFVV